MTAMGVHDHPEFKLGLIPHDTPNERLVEIRWKAGVELQFPDSYDAMSGVTAGLDRNDELGDCGPTSADNHRRIKTKREKGTQIDTPLADVLELYAESTNPPFNPVTGENDNGVMMPDLLNAMRKYGVGGEKIVAFGRLRDMSDSSIMAAIYTFKAVLFAVDLKSAQQAQSRGDNATWDYVAGSNEWGGHAIVAGAYNSGNGLIDVFSWAMRIHTTKTFRQYQLSEVWVPIYQSTIDDKNDNVDWSYMAQQFQSLTGETLPGASPDPSGPPTPTPPGPPVDPGAAPFPGATTEVADRIHRAAVRSRMSVSDWLNKHFSHYFA